MKNPKTLKDLTSEVVTTFKKYEETGTVSWDHNTAARDLSYQVGSLTKALMQIDGERYRDGKTDEELRAVVADELADILAEVLFIAHRLGISMEDAWERMLLSDETKINERRGS